MSTTTARKVPFSDATLSKWRALWIGGYPVVKRMSSLSWSGLKYCWRRKSGFRLGVQGRGGDELDKLGFYWLEELFEITMELNYLAMPNNNNITPISYHKSIGDNRQGKALFFMSTQKGVDVTNEGSSEETWAESLDINLSAKLGFFGNSKLSASTEFIVTHSKTGSSSWYSTSCVTWSGN